MFRRLCIGREIFKKIFRTENNKNDNKGFSLVEIMCALAILGLVSGIIGGVLIATSTNYRKGTKETAMQQEAQLAVNRIGDIIKDAVSVKFSGDVLHIDSGEVWFEVKLNSSEHKLYYSQGPKGGAATSEGVLAENISGFTVDTADFDKKRTVNIGLIVDDGEKTYDLAYNMSARNELTTDTTVGEVVKTASIMVESKVIMVPGESGLLLNVHTKGCTKPLEVECGEGVSASVPSNDVLELALDAGFTGDTTSLILRTAAGDPAAAVKVNIQVRRIKAIEVKYGFDNASGEKLETNSKYTFYGRLTAHTPYLSKMPGASWETNYKNPRAISWELELYNGDLLCSEAQLNDYFSVCEKIEDSDSPTITVQMKKPMDSNMYLKVIGQSMHANGVNKGGVAYDPMVKAFAILRPNLKIADGEISLDPTETAPVKLDMKGGSSTNIECITRGNSDMSTHADFNPADGNVYVYIGREERGSGLSPSNPYDRFTFTIDVMDNNKDKKKSTIKVHVKRVDSLKLDYANVDGKYVFTSKFNVSSRSASQQESEDNSVYLINSKYNPGGVCRSPYSLAVVYSIKVQDNGKVTDLGEIISRTTCHYTEGNPQSDMWWGEFNAFKTNNGYVTYEGYPASHSAVVSGELTEESHINALPTLTLKPTGKEFEKLTVEVVAFHAIGSEGVKYQSAAPGIFANRLKYAEIKDTQVITGTQFRKIKAPDKVIVEPNQGIDDYAMSDSEMVIPFTVNDPSIQTVTVRMKSYGPGTRLSSNYPDGNNPHVDPIVEGKEQESRAGYLGLVIGRDERGKDGIIDVELVGLDGDGAEVTSAPIKVCLRRVEKLELKAFDEDKHRYIDDVNDMNKVGKKVELEAFPKGFGEEGVEYFDIQKDEKGNVCRWETSGHGEYKTPLAIRWTMEYQENGKIKEEELGYWKDYFEPEIKISTDEEKYKSVLTFKIKKPIPSGAKIWATSLHAQGSFDGKKYNKSNKEYAVVRECFEFRTPYEACGLKRGQDHFIFKYSLPNKQAELSINGGQQSAFWRYRVVNDNGTRDPWKGYFKTNEVGLMLKINAGETRLFLPDKEYEIEFVYAVYDYNNKMYWPYSQELCSKLGFVKNWNSAAETPEDEYTYRFSLKKSKIIFVNNPGINGVTEGAVNAGTESNPITVTNGTQINYTVDALFMGTYQNNIKATLEYKNNGRWEEVSYGNFMEVNKDGGTYNDGTDQPNQIKGVLFNNLQNAPYSGTYRIKFGMKDGNFGNVTGTVMNPTIQQLNYDCKLSTDSEGIIYIKINK